MDFGRKMHFLKPPECPKKSLIGCSLWCRYCLWVIRVDSGHWYETPGAPDVFYWVSWNRGGRLMRPYGYRYEHRWQQHDSNHPESCYTLSGCIGNLLHCICGLIGAPGAPDVWSKVFLGGWDKLKSRGGCCYQLRVWQHKDFKKIEKNWSFQKYF